MGGGPRQLYKMYTGSPALTACNVKKSPESIGWDDRPSPPHPQLLCLSAALTQSVRPAQLSCPAHRPPQAALRELIKDRRSSSPTAWHVSCFSRFRSENHRRREADL